MVHIKLHVGDHGRVSCDRRWTVKSVYGIHGDGGDVEEGECPVILFRLRLVGVGTVKKVFLKYGV